MAEEYTPLVDYPDYTQEFAISAVLVDMIPISIKAQTIDTIRIDIAAQSIENISVDIAAQTVGNITVDIAAQSVGNLNVDIKAATAKVGITIDAADITGNLPIDITAQTIGNIAIDIAAQTLSELNVNIAASAVTLNVEVQGTADVRITASTVTLNVSVQGTANVNITDAIVNISSLRLMDSGTIIRLHDEITAGDSVLYTVPAGKKLYLYHAFLNVYHYATGEHVGVLYVHDGTHPYEIFRLVGPDSVDQMNEAVSFSMMSIPAGWTVRLSVNSYSTGEACCIGVLVSA